MTSNRLFNRTGVDRIVTCIVIGAGQAGLSMSHCLTDAAIDHVVLERGEAVNSWKTERWDSLKLLSPNWQARLAGYQYTGNNPHGFMTNAEFINYMEDYAKTIEAPIHTGVSVLRVSRTQNGYRLETNDGEWQCRTLVIATGACNISAIPKLASQLPATVANLCPHQYRNPEQLAEGGVLVVGASASGLQLATEIQQSGRQVIVACGEQVRMPRVYRGRDIMWWMDRSGLFDDRYDEVEDINRSRRLPSAQLVGSDLPRDLDLNTVQDEGVEIVGRLASLHHSRLQFSGSLANVCKLADLKMGRLLKYIDAYIETRYHAAAIPQCAKPDPIRVDSSPRLELDLNSGRIKTIVWATGFRPDYSWLQIPVLDKKGMLQHDGGVVATPGVYVLGLPFMRRRKSQFIDGVADDARDLTAHMQSYLSGDWERSNVSVA